MSTIARSIDASSATRTLMLSSSLAAEHALLGRSQRDQGAEVGALIAEAAADALEDADDLERLAVHGDRACPTSVAASVSSRSGMSAPSTTTRLALLVLGAA